jgi:hypothetical protein
MFRDERLVRQDPSHVSYQKKKNYDNKPFKANGDGEDTEDTGREDEEDDNDDNDNDDDDDDDNDEDEDEDDQELGSYAQDDWNAHHHTPLKNTTLSNKKNHVRARHNTSSATGHMRNKIRIGKEAPSKFGHEIEGAHFSISRTRYIFAVAHDARNFVSTAFLIALVIVSTRAVEAAFEASVQEWLPQSGAGNVAWRWCLALVTCVLFVGVYVWVGLGNERVAHPEEYGDFNSHVCHSAKMYSADEKPNTTSQVGSSTRGRLPHDTAPHSHSLLKMLDKGPMHHSLDGVISA